MFVSILDFSASVSTNQQQFVTHIVKSSRTCLVLTQSNQPLCLNEWDYQEPVFDQSYTMIVRTTWRATMNMLLYKVRGALFDKKQTNIVST